MNSDDDEDDLNDDMMIDNESQTVNKFFKLDYYLKISK